jgi:predicted amidohydrolase YtcJ
VITLALVNGRVWTGNASQPAAEAVAIAGERIVAVGGTDDIRARAGGAETIDLSGAFVVPGFIDSHIHFLDGGFRLTSVQLRDARTRDEFVARIKAFAAGVPAGTWITGGDWDHTLWGGELPRRDWIDVVTPNHPVWVNRLDGPWRWRPGGAPRGRRRRRCRGRRGWRDRARRPARRAVLKDNAMDRCRKARRRLATR